MPSELPPLERCVIVFFVLERPRSLPFAIFFALFQSGNFEFLRYAICVGWPTAKRSIDCVCIALPVL